MPLGNEIVYTLTSLFFTLSLFLHFYASSLTNKKITLNLLSLKRNKIFKAFAVLTGTLLFGKHGNRVGNITSQSCRSCGDTDDGETTQHFLCSCPSLAWLRLKTLENYYLDSPIEMSTLLLMIECVSLMALNGSQELQAKLWIGTRALKG